MKLNEALQNSAKSNETRQNLMTRNLARQEAIAQAGMLHCRNRPFCRKPPNLSINKRQ